MPNLPAIAPVTPTTIVTGLPVEAAHLFPLWEEIIELATQVGGDPYFNPFNDDAPATSNIVDSVLNASYDMSSLRTALSAIVSQLKSITGGTNWYDDPPTTLNALTTTVSALSASKAVWTVGLDADIPVASGKAIGFVYFATDTLKLYIVVNPGGGNAWQSVVEFRPSVLTNKSLYFYNSTTGQFDAIPPPTNANTFLNYDGSNFKWLFQGISSSLLNSPCRYIPSLNQFLFYSTIQGAIDDSNTDEVIIIPPGFYEVDLVLKEGTTLVQNIPESVTLAGRMVVKPNCYIDIHNFITRKLASYPVSGANATTQVQGIVFDGFTAGKLDCLVRITNVTTDYFRPGNTGALYSDSFGFINCANTGTNLPTINIEVKKLEVIGDTNYYSTHRIFIGYDTFYAPNVSAKIASIKIDEIKALYLSHEVLAKSLSLTSTTFVAFQDFTTTAGHHQIIMMTSSSTNHNITCDTMILGGPFKQGFFNSNINVKFFTFNGKLYNFTDTPALFNLCNIYGDTYTIAVRAASSPTVSLFNGGFVSVSTLNVTMISPGMNVIYNAEIDIERINVVDSGLVESYTSRLIRYDNTGALSTYRLSNTIITSTSIMTWLLYVEQTLRVNNSFFNLVKVYDGGGYITYEQPSVGSTQEVLIRDTASKLFLARNFF